jgi:uncharacterized membrane protein (DUF106 family)
MVMKFESVIVIACVIILAVTVVYANYEVDNKRVIRYNCDIAEFHPDYPAAVKEKCRELINENRTSK